MKHITVNVPDLKIVVSVFVNGITPSGFSLPAAGHPVHGRCRAESTSSRDVVPPTQQGHPSRGTHLRLNIFSFKKLSFSPHLHVF